MRPPPDRPTRLPPLTNTWPWMPACVKSRSVQVVLIQSKPDRAGQGQGKVQRTASRPSLAHRAHGIRRQLEVEGSHERAHEVATKRISPQRRPRGLAAAARLWFGHGWMATGEVVVGAGGQHAGHATNLDGQRLHAAQLHPCSGSRANAYSTRKCSATQCTRCAHLCRRPPRLAGPHPLLRKAAQRAGAQATQEEAVCGRAKRGGVSTAMSQHMPDRGSNVTAY